MPYLTSWDVNTFLCLVYWGLPDDVGKKMIRVAKKTHEEFTLSEAFSYWTTNSPSLVRCSRTLYESILKFQINNTLEFPQTRIHVFQRRLNLTKEFKREWRLRSIEDRQKKVMDWCKFGDEQEQNRHQGRLRMFKKDASVDSSYTKNLWKTWEAWSHCEHSPQIMSWGTIRPQPQDRRNYISKWYEGVHPGRFFLFYKKNQIIQERNRGVPSGPCEDGYKYPKTPIYDWGPYEQLIEDLLVLDGPGLGESGSKIEHIDDLFLD